MATSIITSEINAADGTALANVKVIARLLPRPCYETATGVSLPAQVSTTTDVNGQWSLTLTETADITPAGSRYEITEYVSERYGGPVKSLIQVGSSNATLLASLVSQPTAPTPDVYLTQTAADARYAPLGTSFATTAESRPGDSASAGSGTDIARANHVHDRETQAGTAATIAALAGTDLIRGYPYITTDANNITGTGIATPDTSSQPARADSLWVKNAQRFQPGFWNQPWGIMGLVQTTSTTANFTNTLADISGMTITFTAAANRRYKLSVFAGCLLSPSVADEEFYMTFTNSANTVQQQVRFIANNTTKNAPSVQGWVVVSPAAGSVTYKLRGRTNAGTVAIFADATTPFQFLIEDIGPNGAAA